MEAAILPQPDANDISLSQILHTLAEPTRLYIFTKLVSDGTVNCLDIAADLNLHKSTVSHHFKIFREAGLTSTAVVGRDRIVSFRKAELNERFPGLIDALFTGAQLELSQ
ncbi:MAG: helix-turn-helix transcriptional regulator [Corynebacterium sp.]|nr:helix-turn-helix transcriptional regulator [Corynebacterium sp.]